jgi:hypothetical protein
LIQTGASFAQEGGDSWLIGFDAFHQGGVSFGVWSINGRTLGQKSLNFSDAAARSGCTKPLGPIRRQAAKRLKPR